MEHTHNHFEHTSTAQGDKSLKSGLWSWTERRHDWKAKLEHWVGKIKQVQSYQIFFYSCLSGQR